jgi:hypothetical protein
MTMQKQFQCPGCQSPVIYGAQCCNYCGTPLTWQQQTTPPQLHQQPPQYKHQQECGQQFECNPDPPGYKTQGWEDPIKYQQHYRQDNNNSSLLKKSLLGAIAFLVVLLSFLLGVAGIGLTTNEGFLSTPSVTQSSNQPSPAALTSTPSYPNPIPVAKPVPKLHDIAVSDIESNPAYWNVSWQGRAAELQKTTSQINQMYLKTHTYIKGQTDCNDMAVDIWNMLQTAGIVSIIAVGNLDMDSYSFAACDHAWLLIYSMEKGETKPKNFILEATNGQLYFSSDIKSNPKILRYEKGFFYTKPSDLRTDFKERW